MNIRLQNQFLLTALVASLSLILARQMTAQTFRTLYGFTNSNDAANPYGNPYGLVLSGTTLYGTANSGGTSDNGTVFKINSDGGGFTNLYNFTPLDVATSTTNSDGAEPNGLILSGNTLYGTATDGGSSGNGTVFKVNTDGTGFSNLYSFTALDAATANTNSDGANPLAGLILSGATLYGTATYGGNSGNGTLFKVNIDGTGFTNLHSFTALDAGTATTNRDGANPQAGLVLSGNTLYGTAYNGGASGGGTVFAVNTDGTDFTNLYSFTAIKPSTGINIDGANPNGLILSGKALYGTAYGWRSNSGNVCAVFALNTDGTGFTNLHSFTALDIATDTTNGDGANPYASLVLSGNVLYGAAEGGGTSGNGTLFKVNIDGTGFTNLHSFTPLDAATATTNRDGANPQAGLVLSGNTLYGTAYNGGSSGNGTVFSLTLPPPQLTIIPSGGHLNLTWPTNAIGFSLQSTTDLASPVWTTNSLVPVVVNGQNTVTNLISGTQQFFRLSQ